MAGFLKRIPAAKKFIDMRSDTVTRPSRAMRELMLEAEVGDDVMGEDPTVNMLETAVSEMLGKEAALFVPTGTMGNIVSIAAHCARGDEAIVGQMSHIFCHEAAAASALLGVGLCPIKNQEDGTIAIDEIKRWIRIDDPHHPRTTLVSLENTQNICGGKVLPLDYINSVASLCHERGIKLHMDGARFWNAVVASGLSAKDILKNVDSVSFCLSKGLGTPVGSVVSGSAAFIARARRARKLLGGGMRQAGVLAVCGLYALENNIVRLAEDHANAQILAEGIRSTPGLKLVPETVESNIIFFASSSPRFTSLQLQAALKARDVRVSDDEFSDRLRAIVHLDVSHDDILKSVAAIKEAVAELDK